MIYKDLKMVFEYVNINDDVKFQPISKKEFQHYFCF